MVSAVDRLFVRQFSGIFGCSVLGSLGGLAVPVGKGIAKGALAGRGDWV